MLPDDFHEPLTVGLVVERAAQQRLGKSLDRRQRGLEFMRNIGHEIPAHALQAAQFRNVMQHQHGATCFRGPHRRGRHAETAAAYGADFYFAGDLVASGKNLAHRRDQIRLSQTLHKFLPLRASLRQFEDLFERLVAIENALVAANHGHSLHHAAEYGRRPIALVGERVDRLSELRNHAAHRVGKVREFVSRGGALQRRKIPGCRALRKPLYPVDPRRKQKREREGDYRRYDKNAGCGKPQRMPHRRRGI